MKKLILKLSIGFLALVIGVAVVWTSGIFQLLLPTLPPNSSLPAVEIPTANNSDREKSGKVLVNFKGFEYRKSWVANFEITNETTQPIFYVGSKHKADSLHYCTLAVKHEEPFPANHDGKIDNLNIRITDVCHYNSFFSLQTLRPGESIVLAAEDYTVRDMLHIKDSKQETKAQIGFEFFVGEEKHREILWSEEITFPFDKSR